MPWLLGGYMWLYLHRPFEYWTFLGTLQIERLYMLAVMTIWLLQPGKGWVSNRLHLAYALFGMALVVCWMSSPFAAYHGEKIVEDFAKISVFFILFITSIRDERSLRQMLIFYFIALALYQLHSFWEFVGGRYEYRMSTVRMMGVDNTFSNPNSFAATLLHALPFLIPFWKCTKSSQGRALILGYVGLTLLCIFLTGSRRAFLGVGFLTFLLILRSKHRGLLLLLLVFLSPVVWSVMRPDLQDRFLTIFSSDHGPANAQESAMSRWYYFLDGLSLWSQNPITGVGPACFAIALPHGMQPHNLYAQVMSELGTLGILALLLIVLGFWRNAREIKRLYAHHPWREQDFTYLVGTTSWLAIVLMLFMGIGGHNLYRYNWLWFGAFQMVAVHTARRLCHAPSTARVGPVSWSQPQAQWGVVG